MSILKNIVPIFLAVSLSACSSPSVTSMNDILGVFDEGENKEIIKEYLLSEGYKCVKPNQKIALTAEEVGGDFENTQEFTYSDWGPTRDVSDFNELCFKGKASIEVSLDELVIRPERRDNNPQILTVTFLEYIVSATGNQVRGMHMSCGTLDICAEDLPAFKTKISNQLDYEYAIVEEKEVNWYMTGNYKGETENGNTINAYYKFSFDAVGISLFKENFQVAKNEKAAEDEKLQQEAEKINKIRQYGPGAVFSQKSVSFADFDRYIRLECGTTVDCSNHEATVSQVAAAYRSIQGSSDRYVQGYTKACLEGFAALNSLPYHLQGDVGIYPAQFMACNEALRLHFVE